MTIGPLSVDKVRASVNGAEMRLSLLGMSFLGRLSGFEVSQEILTLRP
jgi:predicted aspartyl protease